MSIAINASILQNPKGYGIARFTKGMLKALNNLGFNCIIYPEAVSLESYVDNPDHKLLSKYKLENNYSRLIWNQFKLPGIINRDKISCIYSPLAEGMLFPKCKQVITVHDLIPILYEDSNPRLKYYYKYLLPTLIKNSSKIIVDSENTKKDLIEMFHVDENKIHVIYCGFDNETFVPSSPQKILLTRNKYNLSNFVLTVGESRAYKNFRNLLLAFARVPIADLKLVVVGSLSRLNSELIQLTKDLGISDRIIFTGYIDDKILADLYSSADAFIFPSFYEGFGIPPLEAMSCQCPVIASNTSSIPEVCGNAAYYIDPHNVEEISQAIYLVLSQNSIRIDLAIAGTERVKQFSFDGAAEKLLPLLQDKHT